MKAMRKKRIQNHRPKNDISPYIIEDYNRSCQPAIRSKTVRKPLWKQNLAPIERECAFTSSPMSGRAKRADRVTGWDLYANHPIVMGSDRTAGTPRIRTKPS